MTDTSKLPTKRVDELDNKIEDINNDIESVTNDLQNQINVINERLANHDVLLANHDTRLAVLESHRYIKEMWKSVYNWYRVWSDGFIEQGGPVNTANVGSWASKTITLHKKYSNTQYVLLTQGNWSDASCSSCYISAKTVSNFTLTYAINNQANPGAWYACGY